MLITEPTAEEENSEKKWIALIVTIAIHVFLAIIFVIITVVPAIRDEPELVAKVISSEETRGPKTEKKLVMKQIQKNTKVSAAKPISRMMQASSSAQIVAPSVASINNGPIGLGQGEFGAGMQSASAGSLGSGVSFFGTRSTGRRFLFVLDHSASMLFGKKDELRDRELKKTLNNLPRGTQYQIVLFGPGATFAEANWSVEEKPDGDFVITDSRRKEYVYKSGGAVGYKFQGEERDLPKAAWLQVNPSNISRTLRTIAEIEEFTYGTNWTNALELAHLMRPPPDTIFFMSDGDGNINTDRILKMNRKSGRPTIHSFAMQTERGAAAFFEIADSTGGDFLIIKNDGSPVKVTNPNEVPSIE